MPYTLAKWALWLVATAAIGFIVGWMLRGLRVVPQPTDAPDDAPADRPARAVDIAEVEHLRMRISRMQTLVEERDRMRAELESSRAQVVALEGDLANARATPPPAPTPPAAVPANPAAAPVRQGGPVAASEQDATIGDLRARLWNQEARITELQDLLAAQSAATAPPQPDLEAAAAVLGEKVRFNDLTVVEGIGPKIADVLHTKGAITTWWDLHRTDPSVLRSLLEAAGPRFQVHDPASWPVQAGLLARGQWQEFKSLTDRLRSGRE